MTHGRWVACALSLAAMLPAGARADAYRLRAEALGQTRDGTGLINLDARGEAQRWIAAEASVWAGTGLETDADVLVVLVRARDPGGRGEAQIGRFVWVPGALRPVHMDGVAGRLRLPAGFALEVFGGLPVQPDTEEPTSFDWLAGARVSRQLGDWGSAGVAYMQRRDDGFVSDEEIGFDAGASVASFLDLAGRLAWDLVDPGLAEVHLSAIAHDGPWRAEVFAQQRSPSRLLPASSLFSVLGDVPSRHGGGSIRWRAAPRLDVSATLGMRLVGDDVGESLTGGATLRLDDEGAGALGLEARREGVEGGAWTGIRALARIAIAPRLRTGVEVELVRPDEPDGRGDLWPWGLVSLTWLPADGWQVSGAVLATSTPQYVRRTDALVRVAYTWEARAR